MTDASQRNQSEQAQLVLVAEGMEQLRAGLTAAASPTDQPDLIGPSKQLTSLTGLVRDLSDEVLFRSVEAVPRADHGQVVSAYTDAAGHVGEAVSHYIAAYSELGYQHRYGGRVGPDLNDARKYSFASLQDSHQWACDRLGDGAKRARAVAKDLGTTPPLARAAPTRTTQQVIAHTRAPASAPAPPHSAPAQGTRRTPRPRHSPGIRTP